MDVTFETDGAVCILRLAGRFATGQDAEYLREKTEELRAKACQVIVADFSNVAYIDSTGIGFLIAIYTSMLRTGNTRFAIAAPNRRVREVLALTKLDTILPNYEDVPKAVAALSASAGS